MSDQQENNKAYPQHKYSAGDRVRVRSSECRVGNLEFEETYQVVAYKEVGEPTVYYISGEGSKLVRCMPGDLAYEHTELAPPHYSVDDTTSHGGKCAILRNGSTRMYLQSEFEKWKDLIPYAQIICDHLNKEGERL